MIITVNKLKKMIKSNNVTKVRVDGNTMITKKAYEYAVENGIEVVQVMIPVINRKRMDIMKDPGYHLLRFLAKMRSR